VDIGANSFIPGFDEQLLGAKAGEKRTITITFPADFVTPALAGKQGVYEVEVVEVKEKVLPTVDDAFAKSYNAENLEALRQGVRRDLENELTYSRNSNIRRQVIRALLDRVTNFDLPETALDQETRHVVYDLVQENQKRGLSREQIEQHKDEIYSAATSSAKERLKLAFLLQKIAEKENIGVAKEEIGRRIAAMAEVYNVPADQFLKDLQKRNGLIEVYDQLLNEKVIDFLQQNAQLVEVPPGSLSPVIPPGTAS
jgi:trigger factor